MSKRQGCKSPPRAERGCRRGAKLDRQQREHWDQERQRRGLVSGRDDFGRTGLMSRLDEPRILVRTLPADCLHPRIDFDDPGLARVLPRSFSGRLAQSASDLGNCTSTSDALVHYASIDPAGGSWRAFVAVQRAGGVDVGIGSPARELHPKGSPFADVTGYKLFALIHAIRVAIETQARLIESVIPDGLGPIEIDVALPDAGGSILTGFAAGWPQPERDYDERACWCHEQDVLVRLEVEEWPPKDETQALLTRTALRVGNSFGLLDARFADVGGHSPGQISPSYA